MLDSAKLKLPFRICMNELKNMLRSTKLIMLVMALVFINVQIEKPLEECSRLMGMNISFLEPFAALGNSSVVVLVLPFLFIALMADYPRQGVSMYFYHMRYNKRSWAIGQILYAICCSFLMTFVLLVGSILLSLPFSDMKMDYSDAVTKYVKHFPEKKNDYVVSLIPKNMYNHMNLKTTILHTIALVILYMLLLALIILFFSIINCKLLGVLLDFVIVVLGAITLMINAGIRWVFPMAHTIAYEHFTEYKRESIVSIGYSYLYFGILLSIMIALIIIFSRKYTIK